MAGTNEGCDEKSKSEKDKKGQEKEKAKQPIPTSPGEVEVLLGDEDYQEVIQSTEEPSSSDTVYSSISKYNYIFYFIYKYKYENRFGSYELDEVDK
ncbi:MAG: hypothetical protein JXQ90_02175 [Cyclobacteriaceae bacterium]